MAIISFIFLLTFNNGTRSKKYHTLFVEQIYENRGEQMDISVGDLVTRPSYENDLLFKVHSIQNDIVILHGVELRLIADAPLNDLIRVSDAELSRRRTAERIRTEFSYRLFRQDYQFIKQQTDHDINDQFTGKVKPFHLPAKILHLDGDQIYLRKCIQLYERIGLQVQGIHLKEKEMPSEIKPLIERLQPNIVVITGHDSYSRNKGDKNDLRAYHHSKYFAEAVREARRTVADLDQLIIFAGACQSHFESIIRAGANFASSPGRINIHALDPVYVCAKVAFTPFMERVNVWGVLKNTLTGEQGIGGIETKGILRVGIPFVENEA